MAPLVNGNSTGTIAAAVAKAVAHFTATAVNAGSVGFRCAVEGYACEGTVRFFGMSHAEVRSTCVCHSDES